MIQRPPLPPLQTSPPPSSLKNIYTYFTHLIHQPEYAPSPSLIKHPSLPPNPRRTSLIPIRRRLPVTTLLLLALLLSTTLCIHSLHTSHRDALARREWEERDLWTGIHGLPNSWEWEWAAAFSTPWEQSAALSNAGEERNGEAGDEEWIPPKWYGNSDEVGPSPFDHVPPPLPPGKRKLRVLFLTDYHDYLERMNTNTYEIIDSALRHPWIESVDVWGPKWMWWDGEVTVAENVRRRGWVREEGGRRVEHRDGDVMREGEEEGVWEQGGIWGEEELELAREESLVTGLVRGQRGGEAPEWVRIGEKEGCGDRAFDLVWTFSDIFKPNDPLLTPLLCSSLLAQQVGDCHSLACLNEFYPFASNITVTKYSHELLEVFGWDRMEGILKGKGEMGGGGQEGEMGLMGVSGEGGNGWDYFPGDGGVGEHVEQGAEEKAEEKREEEVEVVGRMPGRGKVDAAVFGFEGSFYPLRTTISTAIIALQTFILRFPHPGYTLDTSPHAYTHPLSTYTLHHPIYAKHEATRNSFASGLRRTRICVFDSSLERKMIRKYVQGMLSGCVVAGDIPTEHESDLAKVMIPLRPSWSIERINREIQYYLDRPALLRKMAMMGFALARSKFSNLRKVTDMLELVGKYRVGARGYDMPNGFSLKCRAYWSDEDSYRPPWCQGLRGLEE